MDDKKKWTQRLKEGGREVTANLIETFFSRLNFLAGCRRTHTFVSFTIPCVIC